MKFNRRGTDMHKSLVDNKMVVVLPFACRYLFAPGENHLQTIEIRCLKSFQRLFL